MSTCRHDERAPRSACSSACSSARSSAGSTTRWLYAGAVLVAFVTLAPDARAQDTSRGARRALAAREEGRPHTVLELGAGLLALPAAEVCPTSLDACSTGEASLGLGIHNIYQFGVWGIGAGILWGTTLRNDAARGLEDLERDHARRYFLAEVLLRYTFLRTPEYEAWGGATVGGVSVLDAWSVRADREPYSDVAFVGPRSLSVGTEGFAASIGGGGHWFFWDNLSVGGQLRYGNWFLPSEPATSPLGDVASLSGRVDFFDLSMTLAYRLAL